MNINPNRAPTFNFFFGENIAIFKGSAAVKPSQNHQRCGQQDGNFTSTWKLSLSYISQMKKCHHWIKLVFHSSQSVANTFSVENVVTREGSESSIHRRWKRKVMQRFRGCAEILVFGRNIHLWGYVICKTKTHIYSPQDLVHRYQRYSPKVCCEGLSDLSGAFVDCWESVGR